MAVLYNSNASVASNTINILGDVRSGQQFTITENAKLTTVETNGVKEGEGTDGTWYLAVYATDVDGKPTGSALATSAGIAHTSLPATQDWLVWDLSSANITLVAGTKYAAICYVTGNLVHPTFNFTVDNNNPDTNHARVTSTDGGSSWTVNATGSDCWIKINGNLIITQNDDTIGYFEV